MPPELAINLNVFPGLVCFLECLQLGKAQLRAVCGDKAGGNNKLHTHMDLENYSTLL